MTCSNPNRPPHNQKQCTAGVWMVIISFLSAGMILATCIFVFQRNT